MVAFVDYLTKKVLFWIENPTEAQWRAMSSGEKRCVGYPVYIA